MGVRRSLLERVRDHALRVRFKNNLCSPITTCPKRMATSGKHTPSALMHYTCLGCRRNFDNRRCGRDIRLTDALPTFPFSDISFFQLISWSQSFTLYLVMWAIAPRGMSEAVLFYSVYQYLPYYPIHDILCYFTLDTLFQLQTSQIIKFTTLHTTPMARIYFPIHV